MNHTNQEFNPLLERGEDEACDATWYRQMTPGTTYWRCLVPARHLPGQVVNLDYTLIKDGDPPYIEGLRGAAVWQFLGDIGRSRLALGIGQAHDIPTFMESDDNYTRPAPYLRNNPNAPWKPTEAEARGGYSHETHRKILPAFDGLIVSTEYLADEYYEYNENVHVCPNSIDPDDWQYEREPHDGVFRIVYYGSYSHSVDTPIITKAMKWAAKQPGVEVWVAGFDPPSWSFGHKVVPWTYNLAEARQNLFKFDLGVAPLKGNRWSNAKSDIKGLEYAMAGVLPLMSDVEPYKPWAQTFPDLLLQDGDWEGVIRWAVKNPDLVKDRAAKAKEWVLENRTIDKSIHLWKEALASV